jgi:hypothetical protein
MGPDFVSAGNLNPPDAIGYRHIRVTETYPVFAVFQAAMLNVVMASRRCRSLRRTAGDDNIMVSNQFQSRAKLGVSPLLRLRFRRVW